ncbi:MAG TPA: ABC transporter ATP-binding protein [Firmicutes bacterium]|nr:ABC transporter ATP-binding protein [Bacillota bacterium]
MFNDTVALEDVTLEIRPGEFFTLLGPSGCGKTTLLRIIAGFERPSAGTVMVGNKRVNDIPPWNRNIGFVFQNYALWPHMTVFSNVAYGLRLRHLDRKQIEEQVEWALGLVGLSGMGKRVPGQLSGGQQQRVAIARALVLRPSVLLLDEPLSNLDAKLRIETRKEIRSLQRELGITAVYVTHDQEEALEISDRIAVMNKGQVQQVGTPEEIYDSPLTRFVAEFVGLTSTVRGVITERGTLRFGDLDLYTFPPSFVASGELPAAGEEVIAAIRPEKIRVSEDASALPLKGKVEEVTYLGSSRRVRVQIASASATTPPLTLLAAYGGAVKPGAEVSVEIEALSLVR